MSTGGVDLDDYRRYLAARFATSTARVRWSVAGEWIRLHPDPAVCTYRDVESWLRDRRVAASSACGLLVALRAFYRWLQREGLAASDPTTIADRPRVPRRIPRPAGERDVGRLLQTDDVRLRALFALMACAGLRCVECSRLDWADVDLEAATVIVNGKGARERLVSLSPDVARTVTALRLLASSRVGPVFVGPSGGRLQPWRVSQLVNDSMRAAGVAATAHQLRHRCATAALQVPGADLLAVRDLLGHASVATTQLYTACLPERTAATSRALGIPAA